MNEFKCKKCDKQFTCKRNLLGHYNKKIKCVDIHNNNLNNPNNSNEPYNQIINDIKLNDIESKNINIESKNKLFTCIYCNFTFSRIDNLTRHVNKFCNAKKEEEDNQEKKDIIKEHNTIFKLLIDKDKRIDTLIEENKKKDYNIQKLVEQIHLIIKDTHKTEKSKNSNKANINNTINSNNNINNNSNNNTVNIQIAQFGKEDFTQIPDSYFQKIIKNPRILGLRVPEEIFKILHFNQDYPQFCNFIVSDFNREKCMVFDGQSWNLDNINIIKDVIEQIVNYGKTKIEEYEEKTNLSKEARNRIKRIDDAIKKCDELHLDDLKEQAEEIEHNQPILNKIKDCEDFAKKTKENIKNIAYNKGKILKNNKNK